MALGKIGITLLERGGKYVINACEHKPAAPSVFGTLRYKAGEYMPKLLDTAKKSEVLPVSPGKHILYTKSGNIGNIDYRIINENLPSFLSKDLPQNWFTVSQNGERKTKPILWLETIIIDSDKRGKNLGTEALRRLYLESVERGCEGRMMCYSAWGSNQFYAKKGWQIYQGLNFRIDKYIKLKNKCLEQIQLLEKEPGKAEELSMLKEKLKGYEEELMNLSKGTPYKEDTIIFNPTSENLEKLFD